MAIKIPADFMVLDATQPWHFISMARAVWCLIGDEERKQVLFQAEQWKEDQRRAGGLWVCSNLVAKRLQEDGD